MSKRAASAVPRKDSNGKWYFVTDGGPGPDGERRQIKRRGYRTRKECQDALDEIRGKVRTQSYVPPAKLTVKEYLTQWVAGLPSSGLRPSTVDGYRRNCDYVINALGGRRLDSLTPLDLDGLYSTLLVSGRRRKPYGALSRRSVFYIHCVLHRALSDAVKKGILARNVAEAASAPSPKSTRPPEASWWTPVELRRFLDLTADEPLNPLFRLTAMTGMRRGEVCGLRWSDTDLDDARLEVRQQLNVVHAPGAPNGGLVFSERTKTDDGRRAIDLDPGTVAVCAPTKSAKRSNAYSSGPDGRTNAASCSHNPTVPRSTRSPSPKCSTGASRAPDSRGCASTTCDTRTSRTSSPRRSSRSSSRADSVTRPPRSHKTGTGTSSSRQARRPRQPSLPWSMAQTAYNFGESPPSHQPEAGA